MRAVASIEIKILLCRYLECDVLGCGTMWSYRWLPVYFDVGKNVWHNPEDYNFVLFCDKMCFVFVTSETNIHSWILVLHP
jgi:hypothetical protein